MSTLSHIFQRVSLLAAVLTLSLASRSALAADAAKEKELIAVLKTGAPADKALACKQLAIHGGKDAVPELAKLLADEQLASWARIPLEAIPGPEADAALRQALDTLEGRLAVGAINSIGVRRDAAAVGKLAAKLKGADAAVASAAAVALGRIGADEAAATLRQSLTAPELAVRSAVAEGCVLCAEQRLNAGKNAVAIEIYDEVRRADVVKPRKLEATRGAILARGADGIPLLLEQLRSPDKHFRNIGLTAARELPGRAVADALAAELGRTPPEQAALLLYALADRKDAVVSPAVLAVAKSGAKPLRIAAIGLIGRSGDAASLGTLLESATDADAELAQAALAAISGLPGEKVNDELVARMGQADGKILGVLIAAAGERRVAAATGPLVKALDHADAGIRRGALRSLGETVGPKDLKVLIAQSLSPKHADDADAARKGLLAACIRMPDRDATATELAAALPRATAANKAHLVMVLGSMGGAKSLSTIAAAMKGGDDEVLDAGTRALGEWLGVDAAPVLLDLAKSSTADKYKVRAVRGYIRLARQYQMPEAQRVEMCRQAFAVASRPEEQKLILAVLERYPALGTLELAIQATKKPGLKDDATRTVLAMGQKLAGKSPEAAAMIKQAGIEAPKIEVIKAEYGAGAMKKDVTEAVRAHLAGAAIGPAAPNYNQLFGGDPAAGVVKQLKITYKINGKQGEAAFAENAAIALPTPK